MARKINEDYMKMTGGHNWHPSQQQDTHHAHGNPHGVKLGLDLDDGMEMSYLLNVRGMPYNEIAKQFGCHSNTVRRWTKKASFRLHEIKEQYELDDLIEARRMYYKLGARRWG